MVQFSNMWMQFLLEHGANISESPVPEVLNFGDEVGQDIGKSGFVAPLTDLGLIAVSGDDASHFLHNQLTNDVEHLGLSEARLAGYCTPKGRLLATFLMWKSSDAVMLQLPRQIQATLQKRLQMFVMRAKAKLTDVTDNFVVLGLAGVSATQVLMEWFDALPAAPYAKTESDAGALMRMPDANGVPRYQWITTVDVAKNAWPKLTAVLQPVGAQAWRLTDIQAGIPHITQSTQEQFVPQMINFEAIGGVNFKKGCYPGQEIVARSQYLGKLKRRMMLATVDAQDVQAGAEVFSDMDPNQPCGMIVNAEISSPGRIECLVEIKTAAVDAGSILLGSANGATLQFKPLPYSLPEPE